MLVISSREFREKQKMYLDMIDNNEQVIVQRGKNKAYVLTPITETDRYFSNPEIIKQIKHSIAQVEQGKVTRVKKEDISKLLGL
jgi:PHD/YefM family antitoxin component YafN of YafNO toxin-antitoxin module